MQQFIYTGEGHTSFHNVSTLEATSFRSILESSGPPGVVPTCGPAPPGNPSEIQIILGPTPDLLNQNSEVGPVILILLSPPGDADACSSLRTTLLEQQISNLNAHTNYLGILLKC